MSALKGLGLFAMVWLMTSCSVFSPNYQQPEVQLTNIERLSSRGLEQRFLITLNILNPNDAALKVSGLSYHLKLQGHKVVSGVSGGLKPIPAFSQSMVKLEASANVFGGLRALESLINNKGEPLEFELVTRISTAWWKFPVTVEEKGSLDLGAL